MNDIDCALSNSISWGNATEIPGLIASGADIHGKSYDSNLRNFS